MRSATTRTLRGVIRRYRRDALASMSRLRYFGAGAAGAAAGIGAPGVAGGAPGAPGFTAFLSPVWPWKVRVGANSPSLWPTLFSGTETGVDVQPLGTSRVCASESGW